MKFQTTAEKDRYYICEIGRLFWGDNKQCCAADAVFRMVKKLIDSQTQHTNPADTIAEGYIKMNICDDVCCPNRIMQIR